MSEISFHESDFDFDDAAHGGGTISGEVFEADGAILTPASSDTESRDEAPADPLTSTNLAAQAAAQAIRHGSNDIISLNEDSDTDSTNTLVRVFAGLSVSDQKLVLAAAARTQMFKRLDRAIQEKSLRAVVGSTTGTSTRVSSTTSSGNGRAQRNALVVSPSVGQAVSTARAPAENGPSGRAFTRDLARYLRSETKGTADIRGLRGWQAICTTIGAVPTENSIPACIRAIKGKHANIYDVLRALDTGEVARTFNTAGELAEYTFREEKIMPKAQAKAKTMLKVFLKELS